MDLVFSGFVRISLGSEHPQRGMIALAQCAIGLVVFVVAHVAAFMKAVSKDSEFGPVDILMKPVGCTSPIPTDPMRHWPNS